MKLLYKSEKYNEQPARMLQEMLLLFVTVRRHRIFGLAQSFRTVISFHANFKSKHKISEFLLWHLHLLFILLCYSSPHIPGLCTPFLPQEPFFCSQVVHIKGKCPACV